MSKEEFLSVLFVMKHSDLRLNVHSYRKNDKEEYEHKEEKCQMCVCDKLLGLSTD